MFASRPTGRFFGRIWDAAGTRSQQVRDTVSQNPLTSAAVGISASFLVASGVWAEECYQYKYLGYHALAASMAIAGFLMLGKAAQMYKTISRDGRSGPSDGDDRPPDEPLPIIPKGSKPDLDTLLDLNDIWRLPRPAETRKLELT